MRDVAGEAGWHDDPLRLFPRRPRRLIGRRWLAAILGLAALAQILVSVGSLPRFGGADWAGPTPAGVAAGPRANPAPVPGGGAAAAAGRETAVRSLLDRHARALLARDRAGWLAAIDPAATAFRARQAALFDNLAAVPLVAWRYVLDGVVSRQLTPAAARRYRSVTVWVPSVTLRYALRAVDAEPTERTQIFTFVLRAGRWYLTTDGDAVTDRSSTWHGLWDFGRVVVLRGRSSLVLAHPSNASRLTGFAAAVDAAVPPVSAIWGAWSKQVAVLIPDTSREMAALVGAQFALARIAAVSIADYADAQVGKARGQRVVINPTNLDRLGTLGRRIVLQHEVTHIASRGVTGPAMPTWLVEGFADFVGYRGSGVPVSVIGQDLRTLLRRGSWPGRLPADKDFRGDSSRLAAAYEEAWYACSLIAARIGLPGLVRFYRKVGSTPGDGAAALAAALRQYLHLSTAQFIAQWGQALRTEFG
jgi:hypothetical protein